MIKTECYLAVLEKFKAQNPQALFEIITRTKNHVLSPSPYLLSLIKSNLITWEQYEILFINELFENTDAMNKIEELRKLSLHKDVFVVCYEKDAKQCHRSIIAKLIRHEYMNFSDAYQKLSNLQFTTIRAQSHGLIADTDIYILIRHKYAGVAKIISAGHRDLGKLPDSFLMQDTDSNSRVNALSILQSIYPDIDFVAILILQWIKKVGGLPSTAQQM